MTGKYLQVIVAVLALVVAGCSSSPYQSTASSYPAASEIAYGTVESIEVTQAGRSGPGLGAAVGAVAGGVLGNQVGSGSGRTAATIGGAVAGGVVGNEVQKRMGDRGEEFRVRVRLDNGAVQVLNQDTASDLRVGSRVRVENGRAYPL